MVVNMPSVSMKLYPIPRLAGSKTPTICPSPLIAAGPYRTVRSTRNGNGGVVTATVDVRKGKRRAVIRAAHRYKVLPHHPAAVVDASRIVFQAARSGDSGQVAADIEEHSCGAVPHDVAIIADRGGSEFGTGIDGGKRREASIAVDPPALCASRRFLVSDDYAPVIDPVTDVEPAPGYAVVVKVPPLSTKPARIPRPGMPSS